MLRGRLRDSCDNLDSSDRLPVTGYRFGIGRSEKAESHTAEMIEEIEESIRDWLTRSLAEPTSGKVAAYCVNLYDSPFRADLIGSSRFDPQDEDWACEEVWSPSIPYLDFPEEYAACPWEERLALCTDALRRYLSEDSSATEILRSAEAVAIGFVDGNLTIVHQRVT